MKKKIIFLPIIILVFYILVCPIKAVNAASFGLMLWYQKVLPTLLPFSILSGILIESGYLSYLTRYLYPVTRWIMPTSEAGSFIFFSGFLFGFPMGSKNCALLYQKNEISKEEAEILAIVCNNISPVFIGSFILEQQLNMPQLILPSYLLIYLPPIFLGNFLLRKPSVKRKQKKINTSQKMPASRFQMNFKIVDTGIMNGFETLTKLGGYIMLFSITASIFTTISLPDRISGLLIGSIELTNGIAAISNLSISPTWKYITAMAFTAFGGISGLAQTFSMTKDCHFSKKNYLYTKLLLMFCTIVFAYVYSLLFD
ncbi:MAG: nucleoside recognition domain-containing protein [Roseburia sp.]